MAIATEIQLPRGPASKDAEQTLKEGVLTYNTDTKQVRVHDGVTKGGHILATNADVESALKDAIVSLGGSLE